MNYMRTAVLLAGLTGLFMAVGYLIGGGSGALIALIIAAGTNLFSYWNADKLVLSMHSTQEVDEHSAPELVAIVRELAQRAGLATAPLFIVNPLSGRGMDNLFSTHPSTENRIAALEKLSREMGLEFRRRGVRRWFEITRSVGMNDLSIRESTHARPN
jgi:heat shock protein HtpX